MNLRSTTRILGGMFAALLLAIAAAWWVTLPAAPDAFYTAPPDQPATPGALLRQEEFLRQVPPGAKAWRILYTTTDVDGTPAVASAIVMISGAAHEGPRPVILWTHGTTGAAPGCAPSLLEAPFASVPALQPLLSQGWIYVAPDYAGLGTSGQHRYLVGEGEARSALDARRALRQVQGADAGDDTVVWGHSQGGHAALWTGILAPTYAPDVAILGVAAIAPASDLRSLIDAAQHTPVGRIMSSYILRSYASTYPDVSADDYTRRWSRVTATDMARRCLEGPGALVLVAEALASGGSLFAASPTEGALGRRLAQNTPDRPMPQPLLIAQGRTDDLVLPGVQDRFVRDRCAAGQVVEYRSYAGRNHLSVVAPDSPLVAELVSWTQDRFERTPWSGTCPQTAGKP